MPHTTQQIAALAWLFAILMCASGCEPKRSPPMTVADLMDDRVMLDGVLMKCNQGDAKVRSDAECHNARIAIERLAQDADPAEVVKHNAEFERNRELLRGAQERLRADQEARMRVDGYALPVVSDPAPPSGAPIASNQPKP